jgi:hypothetical protein
MKYPTTFLLAAAMLLPVSAEVRNIELPPRPPAPIIHAMPIIRQTLADCVGTSTPVGITDQGSGEGQGVEEASGGDTAGFSDGDIDTMMNQVMGQMSKEQEDELKGIMGEMQSQLKDKQKHREAGIEMKKLADCVGGDDAVKEKIRGAILPFTRAIDNAGGKESPQMLRPQFDSADSFKSFIEDKAKGNPDIKGLDIASTTAHVRLHRHAQLFGFIPLGYDADVTIGETGSTTAKGPWWLFAAKNDLGNITDSLSEVGGTQSLRLQMAQDRLAKMLGALSGLLDKSASTTGSILPNLK